MPTAAMGVAEEELELALPLLDSAFFMLVAVVVETIVTAPVRIILVLLVGVMGANTSHLRQT
jgi:hypothetical protein